MSQIIHHPDTHRLGKQPAQPARLMLEDILDIDKALATYTVPANIINSAIMPGGSAMAIKLAMYLNDREGDCTCAGIGNTLRVNSNGKTRLTNAAVQKAYVDVTRQEGAAFNPKTLENDNGCLPLDVLDYWAKTGVGGDVLLGHAAVNMRDEKQWRLALYLTGSIYLGVQLSTDQQSQPIWERGQAEAGSWGGHLPPLIDSWTQIPDGLTIGGVPIPASLGEVFNVATWGGYKPCLGGERGKGFIPFAADEGHALMTDAWLRRAQTDGLINEAALAAYLKTLKSEK